MRRPRYTSRSPRRSELVSGASRWPRFRVPVIVIGVVGVVLAAAGFALGVVAFSAASGRMERVDARPIAVGSSQSGSGRPESSTVASASAGMVEVPKLTRMRADEASVLLEAAGLRVEFIDFGEAVGTEAGRVVQSQAPPAGTVVSIPTTVSLTAPPFAADTSSTQSSAKASDSPGMVVCIDPGHQAHNDTKREPIGPGSKTEKPRATGGLTGVATGAPEYEVALQLAVNLKRRLEDAGVKVVMTRTTNDVSLPNSTRAKIANKAKADLFIRIHSGVSTDPAESGIGTLYPSKNKWTAGIVAPSRRAAKSIERAVCQATGAKARGAFTQMGMAGFNWSKVPSVVVEAGFLSNPLEDKLMSSPQYQDKLAQGVTDGILTYFAEEQ